MFFMKDRNLVKYLDFFSSADDPAELLSPPDFDRLLCLFPVAFLLPERSPTDFVEDLSDPESEEEPDPLEPLDEEDEEPLDEEPDPEDEEEPSSPEPSSSDEDPPPDAEDADLDCLPPPPVGGRFGGILIHFLISIFVRHSNNQFTFYKNAKFSV